MLSTYTDVTKTQARALAKRAREHGYFNGERDGSIDARSIWVNCPECGQRVTGWLPGTSKGYGPIYRALDTAVVDHLTTGDCSAHPDRLAVQ